ncbi:MAG TPA: ABC transporter substrate-binding protein [Alphaproteobacteria bacterium]|jgi:phospholipid transport system substrate-binding protein|nr:ABC transporter substrate-binding protein [Alphaproteobacteria bacterium]
MQGVTAMRRFLIIAVLACMALAPIAAMANDAYVGFVQKMGDQALTQLTGKELSADERKKRVRNILRQNFDVKTIGQFVLGRHWRTATEKQRAEYLDLFEEMIVTTYTQRFEEYSGQQFKATGSNRASSKSKDYVVQSHVLQKDGPAVKVEWRVRSIGNSPKVIDVLIENVSMSVTQRADFDSVIQSGGGKIETLLESMRKRQVTVK